MVPALKAFGPAALLLGITSLAFYMSEFWVLSLLLVSASIALFYSSWRRSLNFDLWIGDPVRVIVPVFTAFQLIYWSWFHVLNPFRYFRDYDWMLVPADFEQATKTCALYLLVHLPYFIFLHHGYVYYAREPRRASQSLNNATIGVLAIVVILCSSFYWSYSLISLPNFTKNVLIEFVGTNIIRYFPIFIGLVAFQVLHRGTRPVIRHFGILILTLSFIVAGFLSMVTKMRIMLLEPFIILLGILHLEIVHERRVKLKKHFFLVMLFSFFFFMLLTTNKFTFFSEGKAGFDEALIFNFERAAQRTASFTTDLILLDENLKNQVFSSREITVFRILEGLPFTSFFWNRPEGYQYNIERLIYLVYRDWSHDVASFAVSGFSELRIVFGIAVMVVFAVVFGMFHGLVAAWSFRVIGSFQWIIVLSIYIMAGFWGISVKNLLEMPTTIFFSTILIYFVTRPMTGRSLRHD